MKAMVLTGHGGLDTYVWHEDWPMPEPGPMEALIRVGACGLNNTDVNTRTGWYSKTVTEATTGAAHAEVGGGDPTWGGRPIEFPRIQGADAVGEVAAVGADADPGLIGKRVMVDGWQRDWSEPENMEKAVYFGSEVDGGFAEYAVCDVRSMAVVDSVLTDAALATFSCSYTTAEGMLNRANAGADDTVLIPGASGGVGGALIQLARRRGARVIALAAEAKHGDVAKLGPDRILPRAPGEPARGAGGRAGHGGRRCRGRALLADADRRPRAGRALHLLRRHRRPHGHARPPHLLPARSHLHRLHRGAEPCLPGRGGIHRAGRDRARAGGDLPAARAARRPAGVHRQASRRQHRGRAVRSGEERKIRAHRAERIRGELRRRDLGAVLVVDPINLRYATGTRNMQVWTMHNVVRYALVFADGPTVLFDLATGRHLSAGLESVSDVRPSIPFDYMLVGVNAETVARR